MKKQFILLCSLLLCGLLFSSLGVIGQNPLAELKFEDAEKNFNTGNYEKAIEYINETEDMVGVTSKTLYLRIVSQDKMLAISGDPDLLKDLRKNTRTYIDALKNQGLDDKFREVYRIQEKLQDYTLNKTSLPANRTSLSEKTQNAEVVLGKHLQAAGGQKAWSGITSVKLATEQFVNGNLTSSSTMKSVQGKYSMVKHKNGAISKLVYNKEKGIGYFAGNIAADKKSSSYKQPLSDATLTQLEKMTTSALALLYGNLYTANLEAVKVENGAFNGEPATILHIANNHVFYSVSTGLLIGKKTENIQNGITISTTTMAFEDFREVNGITLPFTSITKTSYTEEGRQQIIAKVREQTAIDTESSIQVKGLPGKKKESKKSVAGISHIGAALKNNLDDNSNTIQATLRQMETEIITKTIAVKINEYISEAEFE